jgi:ATP-dependent Clp protease ATP-binding subunit ClpC
MKEIERFFRPEFIGRLDDVIVFRPLSRVNLEAIVEFELKKVMKRLIDHGLRIELSEEAKTFLIDKGTNTDFGARPLRRAIEQFVEDPLSEEILRGNFKGKNLIKISAKKEEGEEAVKHLTFDALNVTTEEAAAAAAPKAAATSDAT